MSDIVDRLLDRHEIGPQTRQEAADEIKRLRKMALNHSETLTLANSFSALTEALRTRDSHHRHTRDNRHSANPGTAP